MMIGVYIKYRIDCIYFKDYENKLIKAYGKNNDQ